MEHPRDTQVTPHSNQGVRARVGGYPKGTALDKLFGCACVHVWVIAYVYTCIIDYVCASCLRVCMHASMYMCVRAYGCARMGAECSGDTFYNILRTPGVR